MTVEYCCVKYSYSNSHNLRTIDTIVEYLLKESALYCDFTVTITVLEWDLANLNQIICIINTVCAQKYVWTE